MTSTGTGRRSALTWLAPLLVLALVVALVWVATRDETTGGADTPAARATTAASAPSTAGPTAGPTARPTAAPPVSPSTRNTPDSGLRTIAESTLPREARATLALIRAGGPYPYDQDDRTFQNREGLLPQQQRGYYREYTVETPGSDDRGARRIIAGRDGDRFWTSDHYDSFRQIREGQ